MGVVQEIRQRTIGTLVYTVKNYVEVTKPPSVLLLVFTTLSTMIVAAAGRGIPLPLLLHAIAAATAGCAGANAITCYIDRDIDSLMERTKSRPLPARRIHPPQRALYWGLVLTLLSLVLAWQINLLAFLCMSLGIIDNVVVYSLLVKRRSPLNVIWGGFSGGLPALFGWTAINNSVSLTAILISALVVLWIPNHIWNLAIFYSNDYKKAKVPMLPTVLALEKVLRCMAATVWLLYIFSIALAFVGGFGPIYLGVALVSGLLISLSNTYLVFRPSRRNAWTLFKLSSPYLFVLFAGMMLDVLWRRM
ncbi:MAG: heme o synthase [Anaerolineae bacterium]